MTLTLPENKTFSPFVFNGTTKKPIKLDISLFQIASFLGVQGWVIFTLHAYEDYLWILQLVAEKNQINMDVTTIESYMKACESETHLIPA